MEYIRGFHKTNEQFEAELAIKNPGVKNIDKYITARTRIRFRCQKCGYIFTTVPDSVLRGSGCARCAGILKKTHDQFVAELDSVNPKIEIVGKYVNNRTKIKCHCKKCGNEWYATPADLLGGANCPECSHTSTSFVEQCIYVMFCDIFPGEVVNRDRKTVGKEIDILLPSKKIAVEFGSWFWHRSKTANDLAKINLCKLAGIDLLII